MGGTEWTISRDSDRTNYAFFVSYAGVVLSNYVYRSYGVRPSFSLESDVVLSGGSGSSADPYRLV